MPIDDEQALIFLGAFEQEHTVPDLAEHSLVKIVPFFRLFEKYHLPFVVFQCPFCCNVPRLRMTTT
jgi:hypothetical protein